MTPEDVRRDVRQWLADHWDPDLSLLAWRTQLVESGWLASRPRPGLPSGTAVLPHGGRVTRARGLRHDPQRDRSS